MDSAFEITLLFLVYFNSKMPNVIVLINFSLS